MTQTANLVTYTLGQAVKNIETEVIGQIVQRDGKTEPEVKFTLPTNGKEYHVKISDKWQATDEVVPANVLDKVLEVSENKTANDTPQDEKPESKEKETFEPLSELETEKRKNLVKEYKKQDSAEQNAYLRKCEIIHEIRNEKLFRDSFRNFGEFAVSEFGVTREYAQNLAQIGEFYASAKDFIKDNKLSVNAINQLIRQNNKLMDDLGVGAETLDAFKPVIEKVLQATIEASKNDKGKVSITPRIVNTVANEVSAQMANLKSDKTGKDLIALASELLGSKSSDILTKTRERLADTSKGDKTPSNGTQTANNGNPSETYAGVLSAPVVGCSLHTEFAGNKILSVGTGTFQLKCLCRFRMVGFDAVPYEIEGKKVKAAN